MRQLFSQGEMDAVGLLPGKLLVVVGSYSGNDDLAVDKAAADAVLDAYFPARWKEACTSVTSSKTVTASGGACDHAIIPFLYCDDVIVSPSLYTFNYATGVFTFDATQATGTYTATFVKMIFGGNTSTPESSFPNTTEDVMGYGTDDPIYSSTKYDANKHSIKVSGMYDVGTTYRQYGAVDLMKSFYGSQFDETSDVAFELKRNNNPFFVAHIWWNPDATAGQLEIKKIIHYGCTLNKSLTPMPDGTGGPAKFEADAVSLYAYEVNTIKS